MSLRQRRILLLSVVSVYAVGVASVSYGATFHDKSLRELVEKSAIVALVEVTYVNHSAFDGTFPNTELTLRPIDVIAGYAPGDLTFSLPWGFLPNGMYRVPAGAPMFAVGDRYLAFFKGGEWILNPFTNSFGGLFREVGVPSGKRCLATQAGLSIMDVDQFGIVFGPRIVSSTRQPAELADGYNLCRPVGEVVSLIRSYRQAADLRTTFLQTALSPRRRPELVRPVPVPVPAQ